VFVCDKCSLSDKTAEITAIMISGSALVAAAGCGCENLVLLLVG
jgi:hypothetical protein